MKDNDFRDLLKSIDQARSIKMIRKFFKNLMEISLMFIIIFFCFFFLFILPQILYNSVGFEFTIIIMWSILVLIFAGLKTFVDMEKS